MDRLATMSRLRPLALAALALAGLSFAQIRDLRAAEATGIVECGGAQSTGQLTGASDRITTAAHALYDESGRSRASLGPCLFRIATASGLKSVAILPASVSSGTTTPYSQPGGLDWAVARLAAPIPSIRPYRLAPPPHPGDALTLVAYVGGTLHRETCKVLELAGSTAAAMELRTSCRGRRGMSGAAYVTPGQNPRIVGLHVGKRSFTGEPTSPHAYGDHAFGVVMETPLKLALARR